MSIDVRVTHINVHQPAQWVKRKYNIDGVVAQVRKGGVGTFNEFGKAQDHAYLKSLQSQGIHSFIYKAEAILWDARRFECLKTAKYLIQTGGHVGADGTRKGPDNRRVGPSHHLLVAVLQDRHSGEIFIASVTHLLARAFTVHKWRRPLIYASVRVAGMRLAALAKQYPTGFLIGDMNWIGPRIDWPHLAETQLPLVRTFGAQKYDRAYRWGKARLVPGSMRTFSLKSDHKGVTFVLRVGEGVSEGVPPVSHTGDGPPRPGPKALTPKERRWVRWAKALPRRWKRRHPQRWARIRNRLNRLTRRS